MPRRNRPKKRPSKTPRPKVKKEPQLKIGGTERIWAMAKSFTYHRRSDNDVDVVNNLALSLLPRRFVPFLSIREVWGVTHIELIVSNTKSDKPNFTNYMRRQFHEAARTSCGLSTRDFNQKIIGCDIHHIKPRWLGGDNDESNLVLLPRDFHQLIHTEIDDTAFRLLALLHRFVAEGYKLKGLRAKIEKTKGVRINANGIISLVVPWPKGRLCFPAEIIRQELPDHAEGLLVNHAAAVPILKGSKRPNGRNRRAKNPRSANSR